MTAVRKADKAVKTYRKEGRPNGHSLRPAGPIQRIEPGPVPLNILDRRAGLSHKLPRRGTGIPCKQVGWWSVELVNNVYLSLVYVHQQCWNAYRYGNTDRQSLKVAKRSYYLLQRHLLQWRDVLRHSRVVQQYWNVISTTLRFAEIGTKYRGRPLCGNDRDPFGDRPLSFGV